MTIPLHSQFIQKPVYVALGILSRLSDVAHDVLKLETSNAGRVRLLKTFTLDKYPLYYSCLLVPILDNMHQEMGHLNLPPFKMSYDVDYAFIVEVIDQTQTNPVSIWFSFNSPPYPNSTVREAMRRQQGPKLLTTGTLKTNRVSIDLNTINTPWILLLRICSILKTRITAPLNIRITFVTHNEVFLTWQEMDASSAQCLKTYQVWFRQNDSRPWICVSAGWYLPFPSFHYAPSDGFNVNGK